jgi:hypothetical protein
VYGLLCEPCLTPAELAIIDRLETPDEPALTYQELADEARRPPSSRRGPRRGPVYSERHLRRTLPALERLRAVERVTPAEPDGEHAFRLAMPGSRRR